MLRATTPKDGGCTNHQRNRLHEHQLPSGSLHAFLHCFIFFSYLFLFIWLLRVLVLVSSTLAARRIFSHGMWTQFWHVGSSSLDWIQAPALAIWSLSHWTTREGPVHCFLNFIFNNTSCCRYTEVDSLVRSLRRKSQSGQKPWFLPSASSTK